MMNEKVKKRYVRVSNYFELSRRVVGMVIFKSIFNSKQEASYLACSFLTRSTAREGGSFLTQPLNKTKGYLESAILLKLRFRVRATPYVLIYIYMYV